MECICTFCMFVESWDCVEAKLHCNELLALPFETASEMSQSLASIGQPTTLAHMWRIIEGHNTLVTSPLLICNQHMVNENDEPQPFKVFERYYKMSTIKKSPNWTGHLITCHQYTHPPEKKKKPLPHMVPVSRIECQPQNWVYFNYKPILEWSTSTCISKNGHQTRHMSK